MRPAKLIIALLSTEVILICSALPRERIGPLAREPHNGGIEGAAQPALAWCTRGADGSRSEPLPASSRGPWPSVAAPARFVIKAFTRTP